MSRQRTAIVTCCGRSPDDSRAHTTAPPAHTPRTNATYARSFSLGGVGTHVRTGSDGHGKSRKMTTIESSRSGFVRRAHSPRSATRVWIWSYTKVHTALRHCFGFGLTGLVHPLGRGMILTLALFRFSFRSLLSAVSRHAGEKSLSGEKTQKQIGGYSFEKTKRGCTSSKREGPKRVLRGSPPTRPYSFWTSPPIPHLRIPARLHPRTPLRHHLPVALPHIPLVGRQYAQVVSGRRFNVLFWSRALDTA